MIDLMKRSSTALIVFGVLATIFGLIAAFFPVATALTLVLLWGIYALVDGVTAAVLAFSGDARQSRGFLIFAAVVGIAAGLFAILQPVKSAVALAWVIGLWLLVRGVLELVGAFTNTDVQSRWLLNCAGAWALKVAERFGDHAPMTSIHPGMAVTEAVPRFWKKNRKNSTTSVAGNT